MRRYQITEAILFNKIIVVRSNKIYFRINK